MAAVLMAMPAFARNVLLLAEGSRFAGHYYRAAPAADPGNGRTASMMDGAGRSR